MFDDFLIWCGMAFLAWVLGWSNSCWFPFLLSANYFVRIPSRTLQSILLFGTSSWDRKVKVAPEDRDKMSLTGLITYAVFAVDLVGIALFFLMEAVCPLPPLWQARLHTAYTALGKGFLYIGVGMFLFGCLDYYIGKLDRH